MGDGSLPESTPRLTTRREREREAHRILILDAAEKVFVEKGYEEAAMEAIAQEAEFATGTLYKFYPSKEALFLAVAGRIVEGVSASFVKRIVPLFPEPERALRAYLALRLDEQERHGSFREVMLTAARTSKRRLLAQESTDAAMRIRRQFEAHLERVAELFQRCIDARVVRPIPASDYPPLVEGMLHAVLHFGSVRSAAQSADDRTAVLERSILPLLLERRAEAERRTAP